MRAQVAKRGVTFDTGALIALERRKAGALAMLRACRERRTSITIPAVVVGEWWRGTHAGLLEVGHLEPMSIEIAKAAGILLSRSRGTNTLDAMVVASAAQRGDLIVTDDPRDLKRLCALAQGVQVVEI